MVLLDTNTCIYAIRRRPPSVQLRLNALAPDEVALSVVVAMELEAGAMRAQAQTYAPAVRRWLAAFKLSNAAAHAGAWESCASS